MMNITVQTKKSARFPAKIQSILMLITLFFLLWVQPLMGQEAVGTNKDTLSSHPISSAETPEDTTIIVKKPIEESQDNILEKKQITDKPATTVKKTNANAPVVDAELIEKAISLTKRADLILHFLDLTDEDRTALQNIREEAREHQKKIEQNIEAIKKNNEIKKRARNEAISSLEKLYKSLNSSIIHINKKLSHISDVEIENLKKKYQDAVLEPSSQYSMELLKIEAEIENRAQNRWLGWMGIATVKEKLEEIEMEYANILEKSGNFINQTKERYLDADDIAVIEDLENEIPHEYKEIQTYKDELARIKVPYLHFSVFGVFLIMLVLGIIFYSRTMLHHKKIKRVAQQKKESGESGLMIDEDDEIEIPSFTADLSEVREKNGTEYCEIEMFDIFDDTTIKSVYFSKQALIDIYKFFSDFSTYDGKKNETGCFLVGRWEYVPRTNQQQYDISIEKIVEPSDDAVYGEYNLNFGAKIGITLNYVIENLCEKTKQEYAHTAWMHSHPGLGLFLSAQDLNVQSQLAHSMHQGRMLAIVVDSNTHDWQMALFSPKQNGKMNNDKDAKQTISLKNLYLWANA